MAPWVFAAPAIAFALLPSVVGAEHAADGTALTAAITALCALAGVLVQPLARRLDDHAQQPRRNSGTAVSRLRPRARRDHDADPRHLAARASAIVLGSAYGLCLVAGLVEIQRLGHDGALAGLTAGYYALAYLGFALPYLLAEAAHLASYTILLTLAAALALGTAGLVTRRSARAM